MPSCSAMRRTTSGVPSVEPSSTMTNSAARFRPRMWSRMRRRGSAMRRGLVVGRDDDRDLRLGVPLRHGRGQYHAPPPQLANFACRRAARQRRAGAAKLRAPCPPRGRRAALLVVALVVGFQLPGLGRDGLLSDASALRGTALWRDDFATVWAGAIGSDYVRYFAPWAAFVQRALRAGTLPLWNPYVGTGVPVSEALQPALFHPFTLLLVALPVEHALTVLALLRLALAGLGAFALARVLGCGAPAATLAGVLYGLEPFQLVLRFHTLPNVSACLPWLLALSEHRLRGGRRDATPGGVGARRRARLPRRPLADDGARARRRGRAITSCARSRRPGGARPRGSRFVGARSAARGPRRAGRDLGPHGARARRLRAHLPRAPWRLSAAPGIASRVVPRARGHERRAGPRVRGAPGARARGGRARRARRVPRLAVGGLTLACAAPSRTACRPIADGVGGPAVRRASPTTRAC